MKYWGFSVSPKAVTDVWTVDAKISFNALGEKVQVSLAVPNDKDGFKILSEEVVAKGYKVTRDKKNSRIILDAPQKSGKQNLYYRLSIYDDAQNASLNSLLPAKIDRPILADEERLQMRKTQKLSTSLPGQEKPG